MPAIKHTPVKRDPIELTPKQRLLYISALPFAFAVLAIGIAGLIVLNDEDGTGMLADTAFAANYKAIIAKNAFFAPLIANGGLIATVFVLATLWEDRQAAANTKSKAAKVTKAQAAAGRAEGAGGSGGGTAAPGTKKDD